MSAPRGRPKVVVAKNGPYLVSGGVPLAKQTILADAAGDSQDWRESDPWPAQESYALCRCGHSAQKPFCDGSHTRVRFNGTETARREPYSAQAQLMEGPALDLTDAESLCAFARFCDRDGQVWNQVTRTDDPEVRTQFVRQVNQCPSGRLAAWDHGAPRAHEQALPVSIGVSEDPLEAVSGPLWLRGGIPVIAADGFAYEVRNRVTLCRCGASKNKPFCDGSHAAIKFRDF
ncbi:MAG TPA: CDGSH iron-sulfur domain-containing protein [Steroidobacteraceae bacterium]|jgi:CDGSH-type Zn-finger protein|nr:CDGSH iron-sulfur domain-containing protein [Steroidobacteraceae bacterium]